MKTDDNKNITDKWIDTLNNNKPIAALVLVSSIFAVIVESVHGLKQILEDIPWIKNNIFKIVDLDYILWGGILVGVLTAAIMIKSFVMRHYFEPQPKDTPLQALHKAKWSEMFGAGNSLLMRQVRIKDRDYFVYRQKGDSIWLAPQIVYKTDLDTTKEAFQDALNHILDSQESKKAGKLFDLVNKFAGDTGDKRIEFFWQRQNAEGIIRELSLNAQAMKITLKPIDIE